MATSHRLIHAHLQQSFMGRDVTFSQLQLLHIISDNQPISLKALADKMNVTPGAITQQIDSLDSAGFVVRSQAARDRRVTNITVSEMATQKMDQFRKVREHMFTEATATLDEKELEVFLTVQQKMLAYFEGQQEQKKQKEKRS